jgi:hypothetical protein
VTKDQKIEQLLQRHGIPRIVAAASFVISHRREQAGLQHDNINLSADEITEFLAGLTSLQIKKLGQIAGDLEMTCERLH